jgi:hypothetical protein
MNINPLFSHEALTEDGVAKVQLLRQAFTCLLEAVEETLPGNSREISIIRTKLEEASFYAVKAVRNYKENVA